MNAELLPWIIVLTSIIIFLGHITIIVYSTMDLQRIIYICIDIFAVQ